MSCQRDSLHEYLANFSGQDPLKSVYCPFVQDAGAGMGMEVFGLFFIGFLGLGLSIRVRHPAPVVVAGMLSAGLFATVLPGIGAKLFALVLFFGISIAGFYIYQQASSSGL